MNSRNQFVKKLKSVIKQIIKEENDIAYGYREINDLNKTLKPNEHVWLDDSSGQLKGTKVEKKQYVIMKLRESIEKKDWNGVRSIVSFIDLNM